MSSKSRVDKDQVQGKKDQDVDLVADNVAEKRGPTPIWISTRTRNLLVFGIFAALILLMWFAPSVLYIALGGFALALILSFPVRALSHLMPRWLAILVTYLVLIGLVVSGFVFLVPLLIDQLSNFVKLVPNFARGADQVARDLLKPLADRNLLSGSSPEQVISDLLTRLSDRARSLAQNFLSGLAGFVSTTVSFGVNLFGALFVSIYMLIDVKRIKAFYLRLFPHAYRRDGLELWNSFGVSLSSYLGGLAFVVVIQGVLAGTSLWIIGVPYAILLGAWVSVTAVIPYLGAFLGAIPAIVLALFISPTTAILTAIVYIAIQQLEGNFLTPRIQGQALKVHPIVVLLAVVAGGSLAGLVGVIIAVPTLAVIRVLLDFFRARLRTEEEGKKALS